jgi:hypothetical protein
MSKQITITANNRTGIARMYGVTYKMFVSWVNLEPEIKKVLKPYANKRTLPPAIVKKIIDILGEP